MAAKQAESLHVLVCVCGAAEVLTRLHYSIDQTVLSVLLHIEFTAQEKVNRRPNCDLIRWVF